MKRLEMDVLYSNCFRRGNGLIGLLLVLRNGGSILRFTRRRFVDVLRNRSLVLFFIALLILFIDTYRDPHWEDVFNLE